MFWNKKEVITTEEKVELKARIGELERNYTALEQLVRSLRGLVNKKLGNELTEPIKKSERVINDVLLPDNYGLTG